MDQQPEQQPEQIPTQPMTELPAVPVVTDVPQAPAQFDAPQNPEPPVTPQDAPEQTVPVEQGAPVTQPESIGRPQARFAGLEWQASEYVEHEKSAKWFIVLAIIALVLAALAVFLMSNYTFAILIVVMAVAVAVWAKRPAAIMNYQLDASGVTVNGKHFAIHDFRAFGVLQDGGIYAVMLLPNKRFSPGVTIYFPHELGEQIVDTLGSVLPMETMEPDWIDKLTRKLNF